MRKIIKEKGFVKVYSYAKKYGLLTEKTYYSSVPYAVFVRTAFVRPEEVEKVFFVEAEMDCIRDLSVWFKNYRYERRSLKNNPYFFKSGKTKQKWYEL